MLNGLEKTFFKKARLLEWKVKKAKKILILTHQGPDGDAVGSALALNIYLKKRKKISFIYIPQLPDCLRFLPGFGKIQKRLKDLPLQDFDLIFALDYADKSRIVAPPFLKMEEEKIISIDHHIVGERIGKVKIVEAKSSATSEILYFIFKALKEKINRNIATCILTGIFTDTANFSNLSKRGQEVVAELIKKADLRKIAFFSQRIGFSQVRLLARVLERLEEDESLKLIYSWISLSDIKEKNTKREEYLREPPFFPDFISQIGNARVYLLLSERNGGKVKCSLRSRGNFDVSKIAKKFGGGGHKRASGFKIKGTISVALEKIKNEIRKVL